VYIFKSFLVHVLIWSVLFAIRCLTHKSSELWRAKDQFIKESQWIFESNQRLVCRQKMPCIHTAGASLMDL